MHCICVCVCTTETKTDFSGGYVYGAHANSLVISELEWIILVLIKDAN